MLHLLVTPVVVRGQQSATETRAGSAALFPLAPAYSFCLLKRKKTWLYSCYRLSSSISPLLTFFRCESCSNRSCQVIFNKMIKT